MNDALSKQAESRVSSVEWWVPMVGDLPDALYNALAERKWFTQIILQCALA